MAAFFNVAAGTGTYYVLPGRFTAHASGDYVVERQFAGRETLAAILAVVFVAGEDVPPVEFYLVSRQAVVKKQPDNSRHGDIKIHCRDPVMAVRFEIPPELANLAPALEIVIGISALLKRNNFGKIAEQQGKCTPCADYSNRHIMFVQHKDITIQTRLEFSSNHICYIVLIDKSINRGMEDSVSFATMLTANEMAED